jgi:predicted phosphodiesterase
MTDPFEALMNLPTAPPTPGGTTTGTHPKGWEPGIRWDGNNGEICTVTNNDNPAWDAIIKDWGLDPTTVTIVPGSVQIRAWDANVGGGEIVRLRYYKATVTTRVAAVPDEDIARLCEQISRWKPVTVPTTQDSGQALLVNISDLQAGKTNNGQGSPQLVERYLAMLGNLAGMLKEERRKHPIDAIYLIGMGDLVESCTSSHATQLFTVDLDTRQQQRLVRRLLHKTVDVLTPLTPNLVISAVPGNHGENRVNGKLATRNSDNSDVAVMEQLWDICQTNPERYPNLSAIFPDDLTLILDVCGVNTAWMHGHGTGKGPTRTEQWWATQALGRTPLADAHLLITGHYHHLRVSEATGRTWMQCPAYDPGSDWWTYRTGQSSPHGILTVRVGEGCGPRGWDRLRLLQ